MHARAKLPDSLLRFRSLLRTLHDLDLVLRELAEPALCARHAACVRRCRRVCLRLRLDVRVAAVQPHERHELQHIFVQHVATPYNML
jgi:hypothetical protein